MDSRLCNGLSWFLLLMRRVYLVSTDLPALCCLFTSGTKPNWGELRLKKLKSNFGTSKCLTQFSSRLAGLRQVGLSYQSTYVEQILLPSNKFGKMEFSNLEIILSGVIGNVDN